MAAACCGAVVLFFAEASRETLFSSFNSHPQGAEGDRWGPKAVQHWPRSPWKSLNINENHWKSLKVHENHWKSMKSMKTLGNPWKHYVRNTMYFSKTKNTYVRKHRENKNTYARRTKKRKLEIRTYVTNISKYVRICRGWTGNSLTLACNSFHGCRESAGKNGASRQGLRS